MAGYIKDKPEESSSVRSTHIHKYRENIKGTQKPTERSPYGLILNGLKIWASKQIKKILDHNSKWKINIHEAALILINEQINKEKETSPTKKNF